MLGGRHRGAAAGHLRVRGQHGRLRRADGRPGPLRPGRPVDGYRRRVRRGRVLRGAAHVRPPGDRRRAVLGRQPGGAERRPGRAAGQRRVLRILAHLRAPDQQQRRVLGLQQSWAAGLGGGAGDVHHLRPLPHLRRPDQRGGAVLGRHNESSQPSTHHSCHYRSHKHYYSRCHKHYYSGHHSSASGPRASDHHGLPAELHRGGGLSRALRLLGGAAAHLQAGRRRRHRVGAGLPPGLAEPQSLLPHIHSLHHKPGQRGAGGRKLLHGGPLPVSPGRLQQRAVLHVPALGQGLPPPAARRVPGRPGSVLLALPREQEQQLRLRLQLQRRALPRGAAALRGGLRLPLGRGDLRRGHALRDGRVHDGQLLAARPRGRKRLRRHRGLGPCIQRLPRGEAEAGVRRDRLCRGRELGGRGRARRVCRGELWLLCGHAGPVGGLRLPGGPPSRERHARRRLRHLAALPVPALRPGPRPKQQRARHHALPAPLLAARGRRGGGAAAPQGGPGRCAGRGRQRPGRPVLQEAARVPRRVLRHGQPGRRGAGGRRGHDQRPLGPPGARPVGPLLRDAPGHVPAAAPGRAVRPPRLVRLPLRRAHARGLHVVPAGLPQRAALRVRAGGGGVPLPHPGARHRVQRLVDPAGRDPPLLPAGGPGVLLAVDQRGNAGRQPPRDHRERGP